jgi:hypothetical protein
MTTVGGIEQTPRVEIPQPRLSPDGKPLTRIEQVVVGVDGSDGSVHALVWALRHAREKDHRVLVVTAWPLRHRAFVHEVPGHFNDARWEASEAQVRTIARARSLVEDAPHIESVLVNAPMVEAIIAVAGPERLVVLGTDRRELSAAAPDSLTHRAQDGAGGPVLLIRPPTSA